MSVSAAIEALVGQWLSWDMDGRTRAQVEGWMASGNAKELQSAFGERIAFGTAGLRGEMKAGFANMNLLTVTQATQGLAVYLEAQCPETKTRGVVVGFDGRHNSLEFARRTAAIFVSRGVTRKKKRKKKKKKN